MKNSKPQKIVEHKRELTEPQRLAIDLLSKGKTDIETANLLGLPTDLVTRWRMYDPVFQAALNRYRAELGRVAVDRFRTLIPQALDAIADDLTRIDNPDRSKLALDLLRIVRFFDQKAYGPQEPEAIVRQVVNLERQQSRSKPDDILDSYHGLPPYEEHVSQKWQELQDKATDRTEERG